MIHNRNENKSTEVKEKYKPSLIFTPLEQERKERKENADYFTKNNPNKSEGDIKC